MFFTGLVALGSGVLIFESCANGDCELGQGRKAAALRSSAVVPRECSKGATGLKALLTKSARPKF
jgi:hypothetical protein